MLYPIRTLFFLSLLGLMTLTGCQNDESSSSPPPPTPSPNAVSLTSPARVSEFDDSTLIVTDYASSYLFLVDKSSLQITARIKVAGCSTGIALTNDAIFVGNRTLRSVDVFDRHGNFLHRLGTGKAQFQQINDVAVDTTLSLVYALDTMGKCIKRFYFDGSSAGTDLGAGILEHPTALTVDSRNGNVLVSDFGVPSSPQIRTFTPSGTVLTSILGTSGGWFNPVTIFSTPQGLHVDADGNLFLVDSLSGEVQIFNQDSRTLVKTFGGLGTDTGQLFYPLAVYVDNATRDVYVTDNRNSRITVFRGGGVLP